MHHNHPVAPSKYKHQIMKTTLFPLAALLAATTGLHAQPEGGMPPGMPPVPPVIAVLDADQDGTISAEEIANAPESLASLDQNNDGELTRDELRPPPPEGAENEEGGDEERPRRERNRRGRMGPPPVVAALDADRNGVISAEEIENSPEALTELDKNGDGDLTPEELHPRRGRGGRPPEGGRQGGQGGPPPEGGPRGGQGGPGPRVR